MNKTLLVTRPSYEMTTNYLSAWNEPVVNFAVQEKWQAIDLQTKAANSVNFARHMKKDKPSLVLLNGHGSYEAITGQDSEVLIEAGVNEEILKGKVVHAFSCETGKILGPAAVAGGATSYLGYDEPFVFLVDKDGEKNPLADKLAEQFMTPALTVSYSLLEGNGVKTAHQKSQREFKKRIKKMASGGSKTTYLIRYLQWDMNHQVCLGKNGV